jgi:O-antigen/teichoic acid export membrane protein
MQKSGLYTMVSLFTLIGNILFTIYFVVILKNGVEGVLYASIIMRFLNCCYWLFVTIPKIGLDFNREKLKAMLKYGTPLIPANLSQFIISMSGRYFMTRFTTMINVGLFSLGFKFASMIGFLLLQPFERIWQSEMFEVEKKPEAKELYSRILTYLTFVTTFCAMGISITMAEILSIMADISYKDANKVVPILAWAYVARSIYLYFHLGLYLKKKTKYTAFVSGVTGIITLILNLFLIRSFAEIGAAYVILISYSIMAIGLFLYSQKLYHIRVEGRIIILLLSTILYYLVLGNLFIENVVITILVKVTAILTYPLFLAIIRFYNADEIGKLKNVVKWTHRNVFKRKEQFISH